ncbi:MAG: tRNA (adenosine(37)-N6)-dimethylallyltransferase MiaA [Deltaproteobacteria bacterium RIFCSPLOWO2_12_FULL_44_12]|nr:MAG: tRNA (adenosine(37)-N6)-dimethylallyltransferase MiaA [Deltaproteobacteria bacterium RIFCSPHIGHO2_01_FULL_43_49]OGQ16442.1 MAG: tRNA (adenosine(37)-N6)-dimethylallyltransferase MiaA [Deltaproteobacteria bacterium RIFCSPHIGHO2_02_FULL_44_53]OGQ27730.1 MAG: tRNA (adenosine(37)-N6)-dimethylallyltransferase MiaA [Deltaproteobacteria bacterium RIFCSPHIGHO2_12_FULL_44_21]OGQ32960.1 MAG: tRNA (adenosine(37)-N6)-dimethylallyltransferase MiaA [Deltaproteobacteria bacterium RIFCSPLOWO2_01_FULL_45_
MVQKGLKRIIIICGPTGVGKSKVALAIAKKLNAEIVSADSQQVWKELDIGTAKPSPQALQEVPHHLIDVATPGEHFDVSRYVELADQAIADIIKRGKLPLVVGGAGMYIRVLLYGLCEAPPQDKEIRKRLLEQAKEEGLAVLFEKLRTLDPETSRTLHPNDTTRIVRALEVYELAGKPLSQFQKSHRFQKPRYEASQIGIACDRKILHHKIEQRTDWMIANGWTEEVRELLKFYSSDCQALRSIGYKQIVSHLKGAISLEEALDDIKKQTRAFAKRQLTWFRADKLIQWTQPENAVDFILLQSRFFKPQCTENR